jgi:hypothetical protein
VRQLGQKGTISSRAVSDDDGGEFVLSLGEVEHKAQKCGLGRGVPLARFCGELPERRRIELQRAGESRQARYEYTSTRKQHAKATYCASPCKYRALLVHS